MGVCLIVNGNGTKFEVFETDDLETIERRRQIKEIVQEKERKRAVTILLKICKKLGYDFEDVYTTIREEQSYDEISKETMREIFREV